VDHSPGVTLEDCEYVLLVAGGVGVTPIASMLGDLYNTISRAVRDKQSVTVRLVPLFPPLFAYALRLCYATLVVPSSDCNVIMQYRHVTFIWVVKEPFCLPVIHSLLYATSFPFSCSSFNLNV
jgi:hypothetical protein